MGIFDKVKSVVSKAASSVKSAASSVVSKVSSLRKPSSSSSSVSASSQKTSVSSSPAPTSSSSSVRTPKASSSNPVTSFVSKTLNAINPVNIASKIVNSNTYKALDYGAFGYLPGGLTPKQVQSLDIGQDVQDTAILNYQKSRLRNVQLQEIRAAQDFENQKDYTTESWYEQLGFGVDTGEQKVQALRREGAFYAESTPALDYAASQEAAFQQAKASYPNAESVLNQAVQEANKTSMSSNFTKYLLIGAGVIAVVYLMGNRRK